jgi:microcystin-dependent protein
MKKLLVILSVALLALCGLVVTGAILAGGQPQVKPSLGLLWEAINGLEERIDNEGMPLGAIIMWSGTIDGNGNPVIGGIPDTNWHICDGTELTPDLRDRFVVGSGLNYFTGDMGGANSVTLTASQMPGHDHTLFGSISVALNHNHTLSGSISGAGYHNHPKSGSINSGGSHSHSYGDYSWKSSTNGGAVPGHYVADNDKDVWYFSTGSAGNHTHSDSFSIEQAGHHTHSDSFSIGYAGSHTHSDSFYIGDTGGDSSHENLPPYYALAYIMKIQ